MTSREVDALGDALFHWRMKVFRRYGHLMSWADRRDLCNRHDALVYSKTWE